MPRLAMMALVAVACQAQTGSDGLLERIRARALDQLGRQPDYTCVQTVERFARSGSEQEWLKADTLRLEVGLSNHRELYSWHGAKTLGDQELSEMVGRGTVGSGHFAVLARHVFQPGTAAFTYQGEQEWNSHPAYQFAFDVPREKSSYRLRAGPSEALVAFQGVFWADRETLDLLRMEVQAVDIPEMVGLAQADNIMNYAPVKIGESLALMPVTASLLMVALDGHENMNRMQLSQCREYRAEATVSFAAEEVKPATAVVAVQSGAATLPQGALLELELDGAINTRQAVVGDAVRAVVSKPLKDGTRVVVPQGAAILGRLVRMDKQNLPYPLYEVGLEFHALELDGKRVQIQATMEEAGPAAGLLRQQKSMDPVFTKKRTARMDILVRETPRGQGVLHWEAKRPLIPRGLRMMWRVDEVR
ncbi:MAG: hypothetical protein JJE04_06440 [Acidobacteriia bacterium]|nr:hypothetical protein [Terriglobia bacterium]